MKSELTSKSKHLSVRELSVHMLDVIGGSGVLEITELLSLQDHTDPGPSASRREGLSPGEQDGEVDRELDHRPHQHHVPHADLALVEDEVVGGEENARGESQEGSWSAGVTIDQISWKCHSHRTRTSSIQRIHQTRNSPEPYHVQQISLTRNMT